MASLRSVDVLQIDATIIAGLLILLTIQSATESSKEIGFVDHSNLLEETKIKKQTYSGMVEILKQKLEKIDPADIDRINIVQKQIDDYETKYNEASLEYNERSVIRDQYPEKIPTSQKRITEQQLIQAVAVAMIVPFVGSIGWEVIASFDRKEQQTDMATKGSKIWMIVGFIIVVLGLYFIQQISLYSNS